MADERPRPPVRRERRLANPANPFEDDLVDPLKIALDAQVTAKNPRSFAKAPPIVRPGHTGAAKAPTKPVSKAPSARVKASSPPPAEIPPPVVEPVETPGPAAQTLPPVVEPVETPAPAVQAAPAPVEPVETPAPAAQAAPRVVTWSEQVAADAAAADRGTASPQPANKPAPARPATPRRVRVQPSVVPEASGAEEIALSSLAEGDEEAEKQRIEANRARLVALADRIAAQAPDESDVTLENGVSSYSEPRIEDPEEEAARIAVNRARLEALAARVAASGDLRDAESAIDFAVPTKRSGGSARNRKPNDSDRGDAAS